jgi:hypothetical protein
MNITWNTHLSSQDSAVVQDPEGEGQIVYLFLPLYKVCFGEQLFTLDQSPSLSHLTALAW